MGVRAGGAHREGGGMGKTAVAVKFKPIGGLRLESQDTFTFWSNFSLPGYEALALGLPVIRGLH